MNAIELRDALSDEESRWVVEGVVASLVRQGWSASRILVELPSLPMAIVQRVTARVGVQPVEMIPALPAPSPRAN